MEKYVVLEKKVGETPLQCAENWRVENPQYEGFPLAYAGRLDPMASGKLLILIGDECKNQTSYHGLDKEYEFSVLFGIESDSLDVLGRLSAKDSTATDQGKTWPSGPERPDQSLPNLSEQLKAVADAFLGNIELPYPRFSSKTVQGKALHTWTLEGRLDEIEIPTKESEIYSLEFNKLETISRSDLVEQALTKVNSIPEVTDPRKLIGNDFRRVDVRKDWNNILNSKKLPGKYHIAHFNCTASSGTYMRTLASEIAKKLGTCGLAWYIHRTKIGTFDPSTKTWTNQY